MTNAFARLSAVLLFAILTSAPAEAMKRIYVRADGSDAACDGTASAAAGFAPRCAAASIRQAVALAEAGDVILVESGIYRGSVRIDKPLTILGPNWQLDPTMDIRLPEAVLMHDGAGLAVIDVAASDVRIAGFTFEGAADSRAPRGAYAITANGGAVIENNVMRRFSSGGALFGEGAHQVVANRFEETPRLPLNTNTVSRGNLYDFQPEIRVDAETRIALSRVRPVRPGGGENDESNAGISRYVATSGTDSGDCTSSASPCRTINYAITQATSGDDLNVAAGTYAEDVVIDRALTLIGANAGIDPNTGTRGAETIIVPATNNTNSGHIVTIAASDVTIDGFTVDGNNPSMGGGIVLNGVDVNSAYGIRNPVAASGVLVQNNIVVNLNRTGITLNMVSAGVSSNGNAIRFNKVDNMPSISPNGRGISILNDLYADIQANVVTRTFIGIQTNNFTISGNGSTISGNTIQSYRVGIFHNIHTLGASTFTTVNNTVTTMAGATNNIGLWLNNLTGSVSVLATNNSVSGANAGIQAFNVSTSGAVVVSGGTVTGANYGVRMLNFEPSFGNAPGSQALTVSGTTFDGSLIEGVYVQDDAANPNVGTQSLTLTDAVIDGGLHGVRIDGLDLVLTMTGTTVTGAGDGVHANGGSLTINRNNIYGNSSNGLFLISAASVNSLAINRIALNGATGLANGTAGPINAENNWWGCNAGPGNAGCDSVTGSADTDPRLVLKISAAPASLVIGGTSTLTADLRFNSDDVDTSAAGTLPNGIPVTFDGTLGFVTPVAAPLTAGIATSTFTATAVGTGSGEATVDNQTVTTPIVISCPVLPTPTITGTTGFEHLAVRVGSVDNVITTPEVAGASYVWTLTGATIKSGQGTNSITFDASAPGTVLRVSLVVTDQNGCAYPTAQARFLVDFLDVPGPMPPANEHPFHRFVVLIAINDITAGCGGGNYCPQNSITRAQMAIFLLLAKEGPGYTPPPATGTMFNDVPQGSFGAAWIEELARRGVTGGCGGGNYCPNNPVTREQMSVFLLVTELGSAYVPPAAVGIFDDVPASNNFARWIEDLYNRGITGGCSTTPMLYCPKNAVTRGQMAVFIVTTFDLVWGD